MPESDNYLELSDGRKIDLSQFNSEQIAALADGADTLARMNAQEVIDLLGGGATASGDIGFSVATPADIAFAEGPREPIPQEEFNRDLARFGTEMALSAALTPAGRILAGGAVRAASPLLKPVMNIVADAVGVGAADMAGNMGAQAMFDPQVDMTEAFVAGSVGALTAGLQDHFLTLGQRKIIQKTAQAVEDITRAYSPGPNELDFFIKRPADETIREVMIHPNSPFIGAKNYDDVLKNVREKIGGYSEIPGQPDVSGTLGPKLATLANKISELPGTQMSFRDFQAAIQPEIDGVISMQLMTGTGDEVLSAASNKLNIIREKVAAKNLFPDSREGVDVELFRKAYTKVKDKAAKAQQAIDNISSDIYTDTRSPKFVSGERRAKLEQARDTAVRELDRFEREIANPTLTFNQRWEIQKGLDAENAKAYGRPNAELTVSSEADTAIANATRKMLANQAGTLQGEAAPLGQAFLDVKNEFHLLQRFKTISGRARGALLKESPETNSAFRTLGNVAAGSAIGGMVPGVGSAGVIAGGVAGAARSEVIGALTRKPTITRRKLIERGLDSLNAGILPSFPQVADAGIVLAPTASQAVRPATLSSLASLGYESLVEDAEAAEIVAAHTMQGMGADPSEAPEIFQSEVQRFNQLREIVRQTAAKYGKESDEVVSILSEMSLDIPVGATKRVPSFPGAVEVNGKERLPSSLWPAYKDTLDRNKKLDIGQRTVMLNGLYTSGEIISTPPKHKPGSLVPSENPVLEEDED